MEYEKFKKKVGNKLRRIREKRGLTQMEACGLEISLRSYQRHENGQVGMTFKNLYLLSRRFNLRPSELVDFDLRDKNSPPAKKIKKH